MIFDDLREPADVHGVQRRSTSFGEGESRAAVEIWERGRSEARLEILSTETAREFAVEPTIRNDPFPEKLATPGDVMVVTGATLLAYFSEENVYDTLDLGDPNAAAAVTRGTLVEMLLAGEKFDAIEEGTETVAGRRATYYLFWPNESAGPFMRQFNDSRIWVDEEYSFPLKIELEYSTGDGALAETKTFESIEFDSGFDGSIFEFEPPEGATKKDVF